MKFLVIGLIEINQKHTAKSLKLFDRALIKTAKNPELGRKTDYKNIRAKVISNYLIFYLITD
ncbi:MAG TPA: hypothetical protein VD908_05765, partial [Cytophagales bacterium]|nr:hypothetical protein [Cytophagales bacterium]